MISEIYPFNSSLLTIIIGNLEINKTGKTIRKGYVPLTGIFRDSVLLNKVISEEELLIQTN